MILICMDIPVVIMLEAGLSYLNLEVKPPSPSWGNILAGARPRCGKRRMW